VLPKFPPSADKYSLFLPPLGTQISFFPMFHLRKPSCPQVPFRGPLQKKIFPLCWNPSASTAPYRYHGTLTSVFPSPCRWTLSPQHKSHSPMFFRHAASDLPTCGISSLTFRIPQLFETVPHLLSTRFFWGGGVFGGTTFPSGGSPSLLDPYVLFFSRGSNSHFFPFRMMSVKKRPMEPPYFLVNFSTGFRLSSRSASPL